ncbi:MAG: fructose-1,6-bisphosphatase [Dehalococcoidia bacterium]|nr:fructose-1,6-bisphosphatase [Dehalococcoidia bacterium]MDW8119049.1 fructose-1,6-bisphosphate aldolase/phosphatase [Chloroflexota bacterium]
MRITLSVIKADIGGYVGHSSIHPDLVSTAQEMLEQARRRGILVDYKVMACGDDLQLIMTHTRGEDNSEVHQLAFDVFKAGTAVAKRLKLYGAGQDILSDAFSGNIRGMGPGLAEMEMDERPSEPVIVFMADKTSAGAWNLPLYKMFADPFNTSGLVISESLHKGFSFEIQDVKAHKKIILHAPEEIYDMLMFMGAPSRYAVKRVYNRATGEIAAVSSTERLTEIAGRYVGKDDPVLVVRCQGSFPAVGEVLEPFAHPFIVEGWMRGSHHGPLMPTSFKDANPSRFDGPPRVIAAGFQLAEGKLVGPRDLFDDPAFDQARQEANLLATILRRHGPFEPHRLPLEEMEYTTMAGIMKRLGARWEPM